MIVFIFMAVVILLQLPLLWNFPKAPMMDDDPYDVCIVLGCPAREDGKVSRMQRSRMNKAIQLYKQGNVHTLLISGAGVRNNFVEADIMADYAIKKGIPSSAILLEKKALNTYDNLLLASQLCKEHHLYRVVVVTSCFHIRRSNFFVKKFFQGYAMCPTDEKEKAKHYLAEYVRMWNTLRIEYQINHKK